MKPPKLWIGLLLSTAAFGACDASDVNDKELEVTRLRCRDLENPEGVDRVRLSWQIESDRDDVSQRAWEVEVATTPKLLKRGCADVLRSGKQLSDQQMNIAFDSVSWTPGLRYWWRVRVWNAQDGASEWSDPAAFSVGPDSTQWKARWITARWTPDMAMPCFRKTFDASLHGKRPTRAVVYLSGLGCSDLYFNGRLVDSTRILDPAQSNYEHYALYSTFDVTPLMQRGQNCVGVMLGDGWYNQGVVWGPSFSYGKPIMAARLDLFYADGSTRSIETDSTWQWTTGPIQRANLYAGEVYDASRRVVGWADASFEAKGWHSAVSATEGVIPRAVCPQVMEPIRMHRTIEAVDLWQDSAGHWIYDFGENVAAIPLLEVKQPAGTRLVMRMGETLYPNRTIDFSTTGNGATGVIQTDEYVCRGGGSERWTPRFTYHGFRYLELSGAVTQPERSWIKAVTVYSDVERRGEFKCSDPQLNRLHEMAVRTMLSNIHGLPTDCPHRERCGWLGDAHAVFQFENCNYSMYNFWMKYMEDIRSTSDIFLKNTLHQKLHNNEFYFADKQPGIPFMIAPGRRLCGVASPDWGTAVVQLPWNLYLYYGNREPLERYYGQMKQWTDHVHALCDARGVVPYGLGDWCPPGGNPTIDCPIPLSSTLFHYVDADLTSRAAGVLGLTSDSVRYAQMRDSVGRAVIDNFYDKTLHTFGSQTADAMALSYGVVPASDRQEVARAIVLNMKQKYGDFIHTGIFGFKYVGEALSRNGSAQAAFDAFTKKGTNSFAWMWDQAHATTLWEALPIDPHTTEVGLKASLNHPMQAVYDTWFYEDVAGIRPDPSGAGFKVIRFAPTLTSQLDWAEASLDTPYGETSSKWKHEDGKLEWKIEIPVGASGLVALPEGRTIRVDDLTFDKSRYPLSADGLYRFPSGEYEIEIE